MCICIGLLYTLHLISMATPYQHQPDTGQHLNGSFADAQFKNISCFIPSDNRHLSVEFPHGLDEPRDRLSDVPANNDGSPVTVVDPSGTHDGGTFDSASAANIATHELDDYTACTDPGNAASQQTTELEPIDQEPPAHGDPSALRDPPQGYSMDALLCLWWVQVAIQLQFLFAYNPKNIQQKRLMGALLLFLVVGQHCWESTSHDGLTAQDPTWIQALRRPSMTSDHGTGTENVDTTVTTEMVTGRRTTDLDPPWYNFQCPASEEINHINVDGLSNLDPIQETNAIELLHLPHAAPQSNLSGSTGGVGTSEDINAETTSADAIPQNPTCPPLPAEIIFALTLGLIPGAIPPWVPSKWYASSEAILEMEYIHDHIAALAEHDLLIDFPFYAAVSFDLFHYNSTLASQGLHDWLLFLQTERPLLGTLPQVPVTWGSLADASLSNMVFQYSTTAHPVADLAASPSDHSRLLELDCTRAANVSTAPPTIWLTTCLAGGAPKLFKRPAAPQNSTSPASSSGYTATSEKIHKELRKCPFREDGSPCTTPPRAENKFKVNGIPHCARHARMAKEKGTLVRNKSRHVHKRVCMKRPASAMLLPGRRVTQVICQYVHNSVPCTRPARTEKKYQVNGGHFCKRHAKMTRQEPTRHTPHRVRRRLCMKKPASAQYQPARRLCQFPVTSNTTCNAVLKHFLIVDGLAYCLKHGHEQQGNRTKNARAPLEQLVAQKNQKRAFCQWAGHPTCKAGAHFRVGGPRGLLLCKKHAREHVGYRNVFVNIDDYRDDMFEIHNAGEMDQECPYCHAWNFDGERVGLDKHFNLCCQNGKASDILPLPQTPAVLDNYLVGQDLVSRTFRDHIRAYNAALSFVSFGAQIKPPPGHGPPVFRLHGAVYHASVALDPEKMYDGKYAQLYLYDHGEALRLRTARNPELSQEVMEDLQTMLEDESPYVGAYRQMRDMVLQAVGELLTAAINYTLLSAPSRKKNRTKLLNDEVICETTDARLNKKTAGCKQHLLKSIGASRLSQAVDVRDTPSPNRDNLFHTVLGTNCFLCKTVKPTGRFRRSIVCVRAFVSKYNFLSSKLKLPAGGTSGKLKPKVSNTEGGPYSCRHLARIRRDVMKPKRLLWALRLTPKGISDATIVQPSARLPQSSAVRRAVLQPTVILSFGLKRKLRTA